MPPGVPSLVSPPQHQERGGPAGGGGAHPEDHRLPLRHHADGHADEDQPGSALAPAPHPHLSAHGVRGIIVTSRYVMSRQRHRPRLTHSGS